MKKVILALLILSLIGCGSNVVREKQKLAELAEKEELNQANEFVALANKANHEKNYELQCSYMKTALEHANKVSVSKFDKEKGKRILNDACNYVEQQKVAEKLQQTSKSKADEITTPDIEREINVAAKQSKKSSSISKENQRTIDEKINDNLYEVEQFSGIKFTPKENKINIKKIASNLKINEIEMCEEVAEIYTTRELHYPYNGKNLKAIAENVLYIYHKAFLERLGSEQAVEYFKLSHLKERKEMLETMSDKLLFQMEDRCISFYQ